MGSPASVGRPPVSTVTLRVIAYELRALDMTASSTTGVYHCNHGYVRALTDQYPSLVSAEIKMIAAEHGIWTNQDITNMLISNQRPIQSQVTTALNER